MTYEYYHNVIKGMAPKNAPTYQPPERVEEKSTEEWICTICGYVYDEAEGYPEGGIAPGTKWEDLPEDWVCPECAEPKDQFIEA